MWVNSSRVLLLTTGFSKLLRLVCREKTVTPHMTLIPLLFAKSKNFCFQRSRGRAVVIFFFVTTMKDKTVNLICWTPHFSPPLPLPPAPPSSFALIIHDSHPKSSYQTISSISKVGVSRVSFNLVKVQKLELGMMILPGRLVWVCVLWITLFQTIPMNFSSHTLLLLKVIINYLYRRDITKRAKKAFNFNTWFSEAINAPGL